ncbi:CLUMA_CG004762, isoform A, partial [Clunio marinus]
MDSEVKYMLQRRGQQLAIAGICCDVQVFCILSDYKKSINERIKEVHAHLLEMDIYHEIPNYIKIDVIPLYVLENDSTPFGFQILGALMGYVVVSDSVITEINAVGYHNNAMNGLNIESFKTLKWFCGLCRQPKVGIPTFSGDIASYEKFKSVFNSIMFHQKF